MSPCWQHTTVLTLDAGRVELAVGYRRADTKLSLSEAFALALAKPGGHSLLAGDASLRAMLNAKMLSATAHGCSTKSYGATLELSRCCTRR
jgi:hypothetical protein